MNTSNTDNLIETLRANGYRAGPGHIVAAEVQNNYFFAKGEDFHADKRTYYRDSLVSVAVLSFEIGTPSPLASRFAETIVKVLRKRSRPLIRVTPTTVQAIYRSDRVPTLPDPAHPHSTRPMFDGSLSFSDVPNRYAPGALLRACCENVPLAGDWLDSRTPVTTKRDELPEWNGGEMARQLREFVDGWIRAGKLTEGRSEPMYMAPAMKSSEPEYGEPNISADPRDWDAMDPRRFIAGAADLVRRLRREYLGREPRTGEVIRVVRR